MKTYNGIDLFEAVSNFELKDGTKLRCIHFPTYGQGVEVENGVLIWSDTKTPVRYSHFQDSQFEFEILEDKPKHIEEIDIVPLDIEYAGLSSTERATRSNVNEIHKKVDELSKAVNYLLDKEGK